MFKKILAGLAFCLIGLTAQAQTIIGITGSTCNTAQTTCVLQGDGGQVILVDNPGGPVVSMTIDGNTYQGSVTSTVVTENTLYHKTVDYTATFVPTATMDYAHRLSRSGSGRGGWAWHSHWDFDTVTVY